MENRGLFFCLYAEDRMMFVRTKEAGERVPANISCYIIGTGALLRIAPVSENATDNGRKLRAYSLSHANTRNSFAASSYVLARSGECMKQTGQ